MKSASKFERTTATFDFVTPTRAAESKLGPEMGLSLLVPSQTQPSGRDDALINSENIRI